MAKNEEEAYRAWAKGTPEEVVQETPETPEASENPKQITVNINLK